MQKANNHFTLAGKIAAALSLWMVCGAAFAVQTWNANTSSGNLGSLCNPGTVTSCGTGLSVSGLSAGSGTDFLSASVHNYGAGDNEGLGVVASGENKDNVSGAMDNDSGIDALLLNFTTATKLSTIKLGSVGVDSDLTVFAWQGSTATPTLTTMGPASLVSSGWTFIGNYLNMSTGTAVATTNSIYSSYWLVSAYNSAYGTTTANGETTTDSTADFFKVLAISAQNCEGANCPVIASAARVASVPEPGSLALIGAACMGVLALRRKQRSAGA